MLNLTSSTTRWSYENLRLASIGEERKKPKREGRWKLKEHIEIKHCVFPLRLWRPDPLLCFLQIVILQCLMRLLQSLSVIPKTFLLHRRSVISWCTAIRRTSCIPHFIILDEYLVGFVSWSRESTIHIQHVVLDHTCSWAPTILFRSSLHMRTWWGIL